MSASTEPRYRRIFSLQSSLKTISAKGRNMSKPNKKTAARQRPTMIDLFAGAGGLSEGLQESGFQSLYANEIQSRYAETFSINHPDTFVDQRDIRTVDAKKVRCQVP